MSSEFNPKTPAINFHPRQWIPLIAATILFIFWAIPLADDLIVAVDEGLFFLLNGTLEWHPAWMSVWAFANHRIFDVVMGMTYLGFTLFYCFSASRNVAVHRVAELVILGLVLLGSRFVIGQILDLVNYHRVSPSRALEPAIMLNEAFPAYKIKDGSNSSFPGDHALVSIFLLLYFVARAPRAYALGALMLAIIACVPRLVGGAHWLTDIVVGSFFFAVLAWATVERSGAYDWLVQQMKRLTHPPTVWLHGFLRR